MIEYTARLIARPDTERYRNWLRVFGAGKVYLVDPLPKRADLPGHPQAIIYLGDYKRLDADQRANLITHLSVSFAILPSEVKQEMEQHGVFPILAEDVWVFYGTARWMI